MLLRSNLDVGSMIGVAEELSLLLSQVDNLLNDLSVFILAPGSEHLLHLVPCLCNLALPVKHCGHHDKSILINQF